VEEPSERGSSSAAGCLVACAPGQPRPPSQVYGRALARSRRLRLARGAAPRGRGAGGAAGAVRRMRPGRRPAAFGRCAGGVRCDPRRRPPSQALRRRCAEQRMSGRCVPAGRPRAVTLSMSGGPSRAAARCSARARRCRASAWSPVQSPQAAAGGLPAAPDPRGARLGGSGCGVEQGGPTLLLDGPHPAALRVAHGVAAGAWLCQGRAPVPRCSDAGPVR